MELVLPPVNWANKRGDAGGIGLVDAAAGDQLVDQVLDTLVASQGQAQGADGNVEQIELVRYCKPKL